MTSKNNIRLWALVMLIPIWKFPLTWKLTNWIFPCSMKMNWIPYQAVNSSTMKEI